MVIATHAARCAKLCRSGTSSFSPGRGRRFMGGNIAVRAAPSELGRARGVVVTIHMALLAELVRFPTLEMVIRRRICRRTLQNLAARRRFMEKEDLEFLARVVTLNLGVAASRQSAAMLRKPNWRRSAETPLRGHGSWEGCQGLLATSKPGWFDRLPGSR